MTARELRFQNRHEFRNQLGIILGFAEVLLADADESDPRRADVEEIRQAAVNALELLEHMSHDDSLAADSAR